MQLQLMMQKLLPWGEHVTTEPGRIIWLFPATGKSEKSCTWVHGHIPSN